MYFGYPTVNVNQVITNASNIRAGDNPSYTLADFLSVYPQFGPEEARQEVDPEPVDPLPENSEGGNSSTAVISPAIIQLYIDLADASIKEVRWRKAWKIAIGLFVAHWCTLWLRNSATPEEGKDGIVQAGAVNGIITTESVDGVSYSMDVSQMMQDLAGYGAWTSTDYGVQLATLSKIYGKGMMAIW